MQQSTESIHLHNKQTGAHRGERHIPALRTAALILTAFTVFLFCASCEKTAQSTANIAQAPKQLLTHTPIHPISKQLKSIFTHYYQSGSSRIKELKDCSRKLNNLTIQLLDDNTESSFSPLKTQWSACHHAFQSALPYIQNITENQKSAHLLAARIDSNPIMPGYIDHVQGYPHSGIVNDITLELTRDSIINQQGITADSDISLGFHVIEFLLWGENRYNNNTRERAVSDYHPEEKPDHPNNRRRRYLTLVLDILDRDIQSLSKLWDENQRIPENEDEGIAALKNTIAGMSALVGPEREGSAKENHNDALQKIVLNQLLSKPAENQPSILQYLSRNNHRLAALSSEVARQDKNTQNGRQVLQTVMEVLSVSGKPNVSQETAPQRLGSTLVKSAFK